MPGKTPPWRKGRKSETDAVLTVGIRQGAGATVTESFGTSRKQKRQKPPPKKRKGKRGGPGRSKASMACWDAFATPHMALPRAVAPYSVIRTTAIWQPDTVDRHKLVLFGPIMHVGADAGQWSNGYAIGVNAPLTSLRSTPNGVYQYNFGSMNSASWIAASVTPAAFSIQVMNPEALQTTSGMVYIGRCKNKVHLAEGDNSVSFQTLADNLVSYSNPRMCAAGKLALRGVHVDAVPNNMSELAKFTTLSERDDGPFNLASTNTVHQEGFNPIFLYNPSGINLQVLVCCEWRVRFDPSNPAYAACRMHKPTTDQSWSDHIERAVAMGSGVVDIVEQVARAGRAVGAL